MSEIPRNPRAEERHRAFDEAFLNAMEVLMPGFVERVRAAIPQVSISADDAEGLEEAIQQAGPGYITFVQDDPLNALNAVRNCILQQRERIRHLEAQLEAEGEHTAAANANIDRLNTEIERITRRQQGDLMGKG